MLLALDIGNTTIAIGVFKGKKILHDWRIKTDKDETADEYAVMLLTLFQRAGSRPDRVEAAILSSVVPPLSPVFQGVAKDLFGIEAMVVGPGLKTGMPILYDPALGFDPWHIAMTISAFAIAAAVLIFFYNIYRTLKSDEKATGNLWNSRSPEWQVPSPMPVHNYDHEFEVVGEPYDYGLAGSVYVKMR
jgi:hypothetical protein